MRVVVTGALGHIGSSLIRYLPLVFPEAEIVMIDNLYTQRYCSLFNLPKGNYKFIEANVRSCDIPECDVVVHLAALTEPHNPNLDWTHNITATKNVVRQSRRLIFLSTIEMPASSRTIYEVTKLQEEKIVASHVPDHAILRLGNLFGPSPGMRFHTVVSKFCWQAVLHQPLSVWKTAYYQKRPFLDLIDVVRAICFVIKNECLGTYDLVTQNSPLLDVIKCIEQEIPVEIDFIDHPSMNDVSRDISAAKIEGLGFEFVGDLGQGIRNTISQIRC